MDSKPLEDKCQHLLLVQGMFRYEDIDPSSMTTKETLSRVQTENKQCIFMNTLDFIDEEARIYQMINDYILVVTQYSLKPRLKMFKEGRRKTTME